MEKLMKCALFLKILEIYYRRLMNLAKLRDFNRYAKLQ